MKDDRQIIEPSILAGFMELLPEDQILFDSMINTIKKTYESYGFIPLDTPVIEKSEVLLAKSGGETAKQVYRFNKGDNDLSLRFDLTVPLARYVAQHYGQLTFPFRRYHIGKVYRGEKPQRGRFREFYQCDIDIVGNGNLSVINDAEIVSIIYSTFKALGFGDFTIMINNRKLLNGFFDSVGVDNRLDVMRVIDKIDKVGEAVIAKELLELGLTQVAVDSILELTRLTGTPDEILQQLGKWSIDNASFAEGLNELNQVCQYLNAFKVPQANFALNLKIARGLDYYTGTVYETFLNDYQSLGSVCSGGRYDDLASSYTKQKLPGVGISIGFTRLFYKLREAGIIGGTGRCTPTKLLLIPMQDTMAYTLEIATEIRSKGINVEVYMNEGKMGKKFSYADKLGIPYTAAVGSNEMENGVLNLKDMKSGEQMELTIDEIIRKLCQ